MGGSSVNIAPIPVSGRNEGMRLGDFEIQMRRHIERDTDHVIREGYYRFVYDDVNTIETQIVFSDAARTRRKYEEATKYNSDGSGKVIQRVLSFYDRSGRLYRRIQQSNFTYSTDGKERITGFDAVEVTR